MSRSNSKNKAHIPAGKSISVSVTHQNKVISFKAPMPCPTSTLKELIESHLPQSASSIAYFQTVNEDWLTDYKLQEGTGWIRNDCQLRCVCHKK